MTKNVKYFIGLLWIIIISFFYYKQYSFVEIISGLPAIPTLKIGAQYLTHLACLIFLVISASGWGRIFWKNVYLSHLERFLMSTGLGLGIIAVLTFISGILGIVSSFFYFCILLSGLLFFISVAGKIKGKFDLSMRLCLVFSVIPLFSALIGALAPATQFDSLVYHLALPYKYVSAGKFHFVPYSIFFSFPQNLEMLFQFAMIIDTDILANLISWLFLVLTGIAIFSVGRRYWGSTIALLSSAIWFFTPEVLFLATGTYVDLGLAYFTFLSFYCFLLWSENKSKKWLIFCGIFAGLALGTKYTAVISILVISLLILFSESLKLSVKSAIIFCFFVLLTFSPWIAKNLIFLNNPLAPWAAGFFSKSQIDAQTVSGYLNHIHSHGISVSGLKEILELPWQITTYGFKFGGGFDIIGPVFMLFIPLLFLKQKIDKIEKISLIFTLITLLFWFFSGKVLRFLLPVIPFFCIFAAEGIAGLIRQNGIAKKAAIFFLGLALLHNILIFHWVMAFVDPYSPVFGGENQKEYLSRKLNYFRAVSETVNRLPKETKTIFFGETRSYYCTSNNITPTVFEEHPIILWANSAGNPDELTGNLRKDNITHVFVNNSELKRLNYESNFTVKGMQIWNKFKESKTRLLYEDKYCQFYEIKPL